MTVKVIIYYIQKIYLTNFKILQQEILIFKTFKFNEISIKLTLKLLNFNANLKEGNCLN